MSHHALSNEVISGNVNEVVSQVGVHPLARIPINAKAGVEQVPKGVIGPPVGVQFRELRLDPRHACWHRTLTPHGFKAKARDTNCMQLAVWGNPQPGISLFPLPVSFTRSKWCTKMGTSASLVPTVNPIVRHGVVQIAESLTLTSAPYAYTMSASDSDMV